MRVCVRLSVGIAVSALWAILAPGATAQPQSRIPLPAAPRDAAAAGTTGALPFGALETGRARAQDDLFAMQAYRPSYPFWRHIFTIPDGRIVFGSARDGRLLATFPVKGDWHTDAVWADPSLADALVSSNLPADLTQRRETVAGLLAAEAGPVVQNASRGLFVAPNAQRYGAFLDEWGAIYERFGVPRQLGLAQALVESGFNGSVRSEARAIGFCQWLRGNWRTLQRLSPHPIEAENQTTQAAYCAAYLTILATKYGSFIPALSAHHTGGTNVGRVLINGERLGGETVRARYFLGSEFAHDLRTAAPGVFSEVYGTYGPRSYLYAEMIFGNMANVEAIAASATQLPIFAYRVSRAVSLKTLVKQTGIASAELQRYNPALSSRVPAHAVVYLPKKTRGIGTEVSFWHQAPKAAYASALSRFVALDLGLAEWERPEFDAVLERFRKEFAASHTEEGTVMATLLAYVLKERHENHEREILQDFRASQEILDLFNAAQLQRASVADTSASLEDPVP